MLIFVTIYLKFSKIIYEITIVISLGIYSPISIIRITYMEGPQPGERYFPNSVVYKDYVYLYGGAKDIKTYYYDFWRVIQYFD